MVSFSRLSALFIVGIALLLPLSISASAEPGNAYSQGQYDFYLNWMLPRVEPKKARVLYVSDFAARRASSIKPSVEKEAQATTKPDRDYSAGPYNFYSDWMSPRVAPEKARARVLYVSDFAARRASSIKPSVEKEGQTTASAPSRNYSDGQYDFYLNWMLPRVEPEKARVIEFLSRTTADESDNLVSKQK